MCQGGTAYPVYLEHDSGYKRLVKNKIIISSLNGCMYSNSDPLSP